MFFVAFLDTMKYESYLYVQTAVLGQSLPQPPSPTAEPFLNLKNCSPLRAEKGRLSRVLPLKIFGLKPIYWPIIGQQLWIMSVKFLLSYHIGELGKNTDILKNIKYCSKGLRSQSPGSPGMLGKSVPPQSKLVCLVWSMIIPGIIFFLNLSGEWSGTPWFRNQTVTNSWGNIIFWIYTFLLLW